MLTQHAAVRRRGFTLIELLIVIVVIAILALIVIPRLMSAGDRARSATYHDNLNQIIKGLEQFHADMGCYPASIDDLYSTTLPTDATTGYAGYTTAQFHGPYLTVPTGSGITTAVLLPVNPYVTNTTSSTSATDWTYTVNAGSDYTLVGAVLPPSGY
jgi:type II secretion system protein G